MTDLEKYLVATVVGLLFFILLRVVDHRRLLKLKERSEKLDTERIYSLEGQLKESRLMYGDLVARFRAYLNEYPPKAGAMVPAIPANPEQPK